MANPKLERRFVAAKAAPVTLESREDGENQHIVGTAAIIYDGTPGSEYQLWSDGPWERIMPGTFDRALGEGDDVRGLVNHDSNQLLGRTSAATLKLSADTQGLHYDIDPPDTQPARDAKVSIARGDMTGSSFSFRVTDETWKKEKDKRIREITSVKLFDVGPVTFPAYERTTTGVRSEDDVAEARSSLKALESREATEEADAQAVVDEEASRKERDQATARARMVEIQERG